MRKRQWRFGYIFFYVLFLPDTWQIITGLIAAWVVVPRIRPQDLGAAGGVVLFFMIAVIGYVAAAPLGRWITRALKKWILGDRRP
ncbi:MULTISPECIES: hypothetical protein [Desulfococcus]|uniref:Uncharacterized protein n=1 Tax=Desulfococcus multivorans DSM 2059 TaxID=1121405 RepID=S7U6F2_DESML|nr:hypothetical protein [Desulfococcus multivorans]AOY59106.1 uncharacterized protein Dmul_23340 [Desulfococcus multivorans]AQV01347.1 hypothetical protein B2D07_11655 [Desulfococcus multivorans]EPR44917.1 hypothetical protein dsmv_0953 [Desulfococcus multivorans DSM 2059]MDX9818130.1 hypothetical protein [Desulfococcus multivorans]SJZ83415.1 hypothetical protein SAMN02745446_01797 [Desulfococcus multivorans DSM 2059]